MSEKEQKQQVTSEGKGEVVNSGTPQKKREKEKWSLERCKKAASRFIEEGAWKAGAPSSYKAAVSHGWREQCVAHMSGNVVALKDKKRSSTVDRKLPKTA